jgi:hypothetical protein
MCFVKKSKKMAIIGRMQLKNELPIPWNEKVDLCFVGYSLYARKEMLERYPEANVSIVEIHTMLTRKPEYLEWLKQSPHVPKFMQKSDGEFPNSIEYPKKQIVSEYKSNYFMSSMAYMVALAMYMGYEEIEFFEINMLMDDDLVQKANLEYWCRAAQDQGIELTIHDQCDLLKCPKSYGYEAVNTLGVYIEKEYNHRKEAIRKNLDLALTWMTAAKIQVSECLEEFDGCFNERQNFMNEIFCRHGIEKINPENIDLECPDDIPD